MKTYTVGSRAHKVLEALSVTGKFPHEIKKKIDCQDSIPRMLESLIDPLIHDGLVEMQGTMIVLTPAGSDKLAELGPVKKPTLRAHKISKMEGVYMGEELKRLSVRPGAYDFLACPSLHGEKRG